MKAKFLAAAASVAFIATGVAAMAQENQKHGQSPAAATERAEPKAGGAAHSEGAQAQTERRETTGAQGAGGASHAEGQQNEMKGQGAERSRAAEAPGQQMKNQGAERSRAAEAPGQEHKAGEKSATEQNHQQTPAARTGANEQHNGAKTGAAENKTGAAENKTGAAENKTGANENKTGGAENKTGAAERDRNAPRTGANENNRTNERTGANENGRTNERTGANENNRNGNRTAEQNGQRGQAQVRGNVHMSSEHATRVSESLRRDMQPEHVNVDIRVGERLPSTVQIRPLPQEVIAIVPEYRGYDYFIDENEEIVFVSPQSHEIVGMIQYEGRAASDDATHVRAARPCPTED